MHGNQTAQARLYKKFRNGDVASLADLLEGERHGLYDYLMRMTGQISRSIDTIDEVFQSLTEETLETIDEYAELKVLLYTTARKFNADIWNAETSKLANAAFEDPAKGQELDEKSLRERQGQALLDKAFRSLPGMEREALLLSARGQFDHGEIAEIMGIAEHQVEDKLAVAMAKVEGEYAATGGQAESALLRLPSHPIPPRSSQATVNLSMVMQGIKTKPVGLWSPVRIAFLVLVGVGVILWFAYPELYTKLFLAIKGNGGG
jgi:DNA-directed RNA polymerase specialized sigma24 family protein